MKRKKKIKSGSAVKQVKDLGGKSPATPPGTKIIAFTNFKGGVGKTSCAVNVAGCLARQFKKKVLLIDLDVQSSLGQWLMGPEWWLNWSKHRAKTSYQIFLDVIQGSHAWSIQNSTTEHEDCPRLSICPATFEMLDLDNRLHYELDKPSHPKAFRCLDIIIKAVCGQFDYVIIDCPPNLYLTAQNALFCADHILIPTVPDFLSTAGLMRLVGHLKQLTDHFLLYDPTPAKISGVIFNMYNSRKILMKDTIEEVEAYIQEQRHVNNIFSQNVFTKKVRYLNAVAEAQGRKLPVTVSDPTCEASKDIISLTKKIEEGL
ncbi:ParA family protein [Thermodesulfobacteriota bacterium]